MEVNTESEKVKSTKIKFIVFSIALVLANIVVFKSVSNMKMWVWFFLVSFVVWSISAFVYEFAQRRNKQEAQNTFMDSIDVKTFFMNFDIRKKQHKKKAFLTFLILFVITWLLFIMPISGIISFYFGLIAIIWFSIQFGLNLYNISFPSHLQIKQNFLSAKKNDKYLWSVDFMQKVSFEADYINGELIRRFYIREPQQISSISFFEHEMPQFATFLEALAKVMEYDSQLFYLSTHGIAIPLKDLSIKTIEDTRPKPIVKRSLFQLLFKSLWNLLNIFSSQYNQFGHRYILGRTRRGIFIISLALGLVQGLFTYDYFRPFYITPYPADNKLIVDSGILSEVYVRKGSDYLILTKADGKKIQLSDIRKFDDWQKQAMTDQFSVKVWWFPLNGSNRGWISKIEMKGVEVLSPQEQKQSFMQNIDSYHEWLQTTYLFLIPALLAWIWEFIVRYKINKQLVVKSETDAESSSA